MIDSKWWLRALIGAAAGLSLVVSSVFLTQLLSPTHQKADPPPAALVESVIDGDTLVLSISGQSERVRLVGIDTPESVSPQTPVQCFGAESTQALQGLVAPGDTVQISADLERRDRYGRLLLYVHTDQGIFINQWLVESGFADVLFFEPNTALRAPFTAARNEARSGDVGLWGQCDGPDQPLG